MLTVSASPPHATRSELLDARRLERREFVIATGALDSSPYFAQHFGRREILAHDAYRQSGAFARDANAPATCMADPGEDSLLPPPHPRIGVVSGAPTRTALEVQRAKDRRIANLRFERSDQARRASNLGEWLLRGSTADAQSDGGHHDDGSGARLFQARRRHDRLHPELSVAVDPGKLRSPEASDEKRRQLERRAELAPKVTRVRHEGPDDYRCVDRVDVANAMRASDLFAYERAAPSTSCGVRRVCAKASDSASGSGWTLPISPIKDAGARTARQRQPGSTIECLVTESLAQRSVLDQLKAVQPYSPSSRVATPAMLSPLASHGQSHQQLRQAGTVAPIEPVRCGGFS